LLCGTRRARVESSNIVFDLVVSAGEKGDIPGFSFHGCMHTKRSVQGSGCLVHTIGGAWMGKSLVRLGLVDVSVGAVTVINISCCW